MTQRPTETDPIKPEPQQRQKRDKSRKPPPKRPSKKPSKKVRLKAARQSIKESMTPQGICENSALQQINHDAAGIDLGAFNHLVAVPADRDERSVRSFTTFTCDLEAIADWLQSCRIKTVAMESTGVYWISLMEVLERRGFEVLLVDARTTKNVTGRKSDVLDCQWIQQLHTYGLLNGAFRPAEEILPLRSFARQRSTLIKRSGTEVQHMQKALTQMNVKLTTVLSDVTGKTGMKIIRAILDGERDPATLAKLRHGRCRHDEATIAKALEGNWREDHLFALHQAVETYDFTRKQIVDCDRKLEAELGKFSDAKPDLEPLEEKTKSRSPHALSFNCYSELHRIAGVDLTAVPGLDASTVLTIVSEIGLDMWRWRSSKAFSNWLGLCPGSKITGGKRLSSKTKACANRAAAAFRLAAYGLQNSKTYIGAFHRRMKVRLGPAGAITATAHKLARIVYAMLRARKAYDEKGIDHYENQYKDRRIANLKRNARALGYQLIVAPDEPPPSGAASEVPSSSDAALAA